MRLLIVANLRKMRVRPAVGELTDWIRQTFPNVHIVGVEAAEPPPGPNLGPVLWNRVLIQGFIVSDHLDRLADFLRDATAWVREGRLKYREDVVHGLERAPEALIGLLRGRNLGKMLVRVADDPTRR